MIWFVVIAVVVFVGFKFFSSLEQDKDELQSRTLDDKFQTIVSMINEAAFSGRGTVTVIGKREFNLYETDSNQIIKFQYSTGSLTITWKYKYFQKELVHERQFDNVRNLSVFEQARIGQAMIDEMQRAVIKHKEEVERPLAIKQQVVEPRPSVTHGPSIFPNGPQLTESVVIEDNSVGRITVHESSIDEVIQSFGESFKTREHNNFSKEYYYESLGLSFYHKLADSRKIVFLVKIISPFSGATVEGLKIGQSTVIDVFSNYGNPIRLQQGSAGDPLGYFTYDSLSFGFRLGTEAMAGIFDIEKEADKKLIAIKLV